MAMERDGLNSGLITDNGKLGATEVKWPKWALAILFLVDGTGFGSWAAHVPVFKQFLHIENGSLTVVLTSVIVGALISMPLTGQFIARYGSRRVTQVVAISYILTIALLAQASSLLFLVIFAGLFGAAKGAFDISINAQAMAVEKHYGQSSMSFFQGCWSAGGLLGAAGGPLPGLHHAGAVLGQPGTAGGQPRPLRGGGGGASRPFLVGWDPPLRPVRAADGGVLQRPGQSPAI